MWTYFLLREEEYVSCIVVSLGIDFFEENFFFLEVIYAKVERC